MVIMTNNDIILMVSNIRLAAVIIMVVAIEVINVVMAMEVVIIMVLIRIVAIVVITVAVAYEFIIVMVTALIMVVAIKVMIEVTNRSIGKRIVAVAMEVITFTVKW